MEGAEAFHLAFTFSYCRRRNYTSKGSSKPIFAPYFLGTGLDFSDPHLSRLFVVVVPVFFWGKLRSTEPAESEQMPYMENPTAVCSDLTWSVKRDFDKLAAAFPNMTLIWSALLEKRVWRNSLCPAAANKAGKTGEPSGDSEGGRTEGPGDCAPRHYVQQKRPSSVLMAYIFEIKGNDVWLAVVSEGIRGWLQV